jgi:long-chain acyl-CoA synthetase
MTDNGVLHSGFLRAAALHPDKTALVCGEVAVSFADVERRASGIAAALDARLARRVAICLPNGPHVIDTFFGTVMAGACVMLCDPAWPSALLKSLIAEHAPNIVIAENEILDSVADVIEEDVRWSPEQVETLAAKGDTGAALRSVPCPDSPFLIGFTSGSSGRPKAFIRSHATWVESFAMSAQELGTDANSVVVAPGPLSHGLSLYAVIETLCAGGMAVIQPHFDAPLVYAAVAVREATTLVVVPAMLDVLLELAAPETCASVSGIVTAGAKLSPALRQQAHARFPNADIIEYYGASELSFVTVAKGRENPPPASVGRAFAGVELDVRDETGSSLPPNTTGTVWVRSAMVCTGYVGETDGSGMRTAGDWATVGDLGHTDANGFLYLDGREGSAITSAGYTVYPSAIEAALLSSPDVADAVVIGLPHARWGEVIAAAVVPVAGRTLHTETLSAHCHAVLEPYACPRRWAVVDGFARTQSGKPVRDGIADLFANDSDV